MKYFKDADSPETYLAKMLWLVVAGGLLVFALCAVAMLQMSDIGCVK